MRCFSTLRHHTSTQRNRPLLPLCAPTVPQPYRFRHLPAALSLPPCFFTPLLGFFCRFITLSCNRYPFEGLWQNQNRQKMQGVQLV